MVWPGQQADFWALDKHKGCGTEDFWKAEETYNQMYFLVSSCNGYGVFVEWVESRPHIRMGKNDDIPFIIINSVFDLTMDSSYNPFC